MSEKQQRLVLAIIDFLNQSMDDGTVKQDDKEGLEVAVQCIGEAFGVDPSNSEQSKRLSIKPTSLTSLLDLYLTTRERMNTTTSPTASASTSSGTSEADKLEAETLKAKGNTLMSSKDYAGAINAYTQAISLDGTNAVYYSNRAAAHSSKGDHALAIEDAQCAIDIDSSFSKAYHRLGHAHYSLGDYSSAADAFRRGLEIDPANANLKSGLQNAEARVDTQPTPQQPPASARGAPGGGGIADMLAGLGGLGGGAGAGGGGGGMPDLASMMQNPMMMQMAQQMMANGGMERMMSNPAVANMMERAQSGGGMPSMQEIMADPSLRDLASQFTGGLGGAGQGGPPAGSA